MTVKEYTPGDELENEDGFVVEASYYEVSGMRINLTKHGQEDTSAFLCLTVNNDLGDQGDFELVKLLTHAKTNNLWFRLSEEGKAMNLVMDISQVTELEQVLQYYQDNRQVH